jgi:hypothetical protein
MSPFHVSGRPEVCSRHAHTRTHLYTHVRTRTHARTSHPSFFGKERNACRVGHSLSVATCRSPRLATYSNKYSLSPRPGSEPLTQGLPCSLAHSLTRSLMWLLADPESTLAHSWRLQLLPTRLVPAALTLGCLLLLERGQTDRQRQGRKGRKVVVA